MNTNTRIQKSTAAAVIALIAAAAFTACATLRTDGDAPRSVDSARISELSQGYRELAQARVESARAASEAARIDAARRSAASRELAQARVESARAEAEATRSHAVADSADAYRALAESRAESSRVLAGQRSTDYLDLAERRARVAD